MRTRRGFHSARAVAAESGKSVSAALRSIHRLAGAGLVAIAHYANNSVFARPKEAGHDD